VLKNEVPAAIFDGVASSLWTAGLAAVSNGFPLLSDVEDDDAGKPEANGLKGSVLLTGDDDDDAVLFVPVTEVAANGLLKGLLVFAAAGADDEVAPDLAANGLLNGLLVFAADGVPVNDDVAPDFAANGLLNGLIVPAGGVDADALPPVVVLVVEVDVANGLLPDSLASFFPAVANGLLPFAAGGPVLLVLPAVANGLLLFPAIGLVPPPAFANGLLPIAVSGVGVANGLLLFPAAAGLSSTESLSVTSLLPPSNAPSEMVLADSGSIGLGPAIFFFSA